jgi:hypothetical protein
MYVTLLHYFSRLWTCFHEVGFVVLTVDVDCTGHRIVFSSIVLYVGEVSASVRLIV